MFINKILILFLLLRNTGRLTVKKTQFKEMMEIPSDVRSQMNGADVDRNISPAVALGPEGWGPLTEKCCTLLFH